jgi:putative phosphoribosyl transferase
MRFHDRTDAGRQLARLLTERDLHEPVVLALPRGGVPVAAEVASALAAPLEVFVVRKLGAPARPELGIGAIAECDGLVVDRHAVDALGLSDDDVAALIGREREELERRVQHYRSGRDLPDLAGRDIVLVDDGLATGVTAGAALQGLRGHRPRAIVLAVPACAPATVGRLSAAADDVVCALTPQNFAAVGQWYENFDQITDGEVVEILQRTSAAGAAEGPGTP